MIKLLPFQEIGRDFLAGSKNAILGDDMGLGKTYQALEAIKKLYISSGIIVCPQSIRRSWVKRIREQIPLAFIKEITSPKVMPETTAFNVVNYDIIWREPLISRLKEQQWPFLLCDEFHYLKNIETKRTKAVLGRRGLYSKCDRRWMMSGTPVLNRPIELFAVLRSLFPAFLGRYTNFYDYAFKYCSGHQGVFGFDCNGASNLEELAQILKPIMLRRLKREVAKDLPPVIYNKVYLDPSDKLIKLTEAELKGFDFKETSEELSSIRRALGVIKAVAAAKHIKDILEEKNKVVVFVWHKDVAQMIFDSFKKNAVLYIGATSVAKKERALNEFISQQNKKVFIGNLQSAGVGVDGLQHVCDHGVFVELSYVPNEIKQAIGRLDRMGQESPVQIDFLVAENSVDEQTIDRLTEKAKNINVIMDEQQGGENDFVDTKCQICKKSTEIKNLKRVVSLSVCEKCGKMMECLL